MIRKRLFMTLFHKDRKKGKDKWKIRADCCFKNKQKLQNVKNDLSLRHLSCSTTEEIPFILIHQNVFGYLLIIFLSSH